MAEFRVKDDANVEGTFFLSAPEGVVTIEEGQTVTVDDENRGLVAVLSNNSRLERVDEYDEPLPEDQPVEEESRVDVLRRDIEARQAAGDPTGAQEAELAALENSEAESVATEGEEDSSPTVVGTPPPKPGTDAPDPDAGTPADFSDGDDR